MLEPTDEPGPEDEQLDQEIRNHIDRIRTLVFELNLLLRAASMYGVDINIDTTERIDPVTKNEYSEIIISGIPDHEDDEPI